MYYKPLEKLSHLHTKTLNRLQENMLTYDFQIQYKKGATLPADFLSRDIVKGLDKVVNSIDPFAPDLQQLQLEDEQLIKINSFQKEGKWQLTPGPYCGRGQPGRGQSAKLGGAPYFQNTKIHHRCKILQY